jgi:Ca2+-binding RTX toxin-like protein
VKHSSKTVVGTVALVLPTLIAASAVAATVVGTAGDDVLHGTPQADSIFGKAGNDEIWSGAGPDRVVGGTGNDTIHGGAGKDLILADLARLGRGGGDDVVYAGRGDDVVHPAGGTNLIFLGRGNDWVSDIPNDGVARDDVIHLGPGRDLAELDKGRRVVHAGAGADQVSVWGADARVYGGRGDDVLHADIDGVGSGDNALYGGRRHDELWLERGTPQDFLSGGPGNDEIYYGYPATGGTTIRCGAGYDTVTILYDAEPYGEPPILTNCERVRIR